MLASSAWFQSFWLCGGLVMRLGQKNSLTMKRLVQAAMGQYIGLGKAKYHVNEQIILGQGAFGIVNRATNKYTQQPVAIKKMWKHSRNYKESLVMEEIKIGRRLRHPHLCRFIEYFNESSAMILVLEYCTDGDLTDTIKRKGSKITNSIAQQWMYQILLGVSFMHSDGIDVCHRDLKPDNCMFTREFEQLKLCDFGIATIVPKGDMLSLKCGTQAFMSPEMMKGRYSFPCDIWAVGCIMYTMLNNNQHPFIEKGNTWRGDLQSTGNVIFKKDSWLYEKAMATINKTKAKDAATAQQLCSQMCTVDAKQRPTAAQCMNHEWFKAQLPQLEKDFELLKNNEPSDQACGFC